MSHEQNNPKTEENIKKQLIEQAASEIDSIHFTGYMLRSKIYTAKEKMISNIREDNEQYMSDVAYDAKNRTELIRQMGEAAKKGDFEEMQRIKNILLVDNDKS